ncbi:MAG: SGNH/GDSL hydrolase family protein [Bryobacteraceae bacterium]
MNRTHASNSLLLRIVLCWAALVPQLASAGPADEAKATWYDLAKFPIEGKGWKATKHLYDRLPAKAEAVVREPVWRLAKDSAGLRYRFVTDAPFLRARWKLRKPELAMPHMPATGVSGLDLYVRDAGEWHWLAVGRAEKPVNEVTLVDGLTRQKREYLLYLPLYNGVESVELGLPEDAVLEQGPSRYGSRKPVVFYGTSILQGGCAARPGMAYPSIIGRMIDWPTINLGFSGNGKTEPEMASLLAELDPSAYVLDSLPNLTVQEVAERVGPFAKTLRAAHPTVPIVFVESITYTDSHFRQIRQDRVNGSNSALRAIYDAMKKEGDKNLYYIAASMLLGGDGEDTVDGSHPTDLGFARMAQGIAPVVREALEASGARPRGEEDFEPLFDGKTTSGWSVHQGMPKEHIGGKWWVEDGVLVGTQDPPGKGGLFVTSREFKNFVLRLDFKLDYPVDSGIFLRVGPDGQSHQVTLDYRPGSDIGAIYVPFTQKYVHRNWEGIRTLREGEWNTAEVRVEGEPSRIRFWLNGRLLTDFQHTEASTKGVPRRGGIALQVHPDVGKLALWKDGNRVRFRNIRVRVLP